MKVLRSMWLLLAICCTMLIMQSCEDECVDGICDCPSGYTGANCENFDSDEVQILLDGGITPLELLNDNIPLSSFYGLSYEGGLIFYLNANGEGMVAATEDQNTDVAWGCLGDPIDGADAEIIGSGTQNTMEILGGCDSPGIAARLCDNLNLNGYSDWFLPSKDELNLMWVRLADSDGDGYSSGAGHPGNIGGFDSGFYWTSTEFSDSRVWFQFFSTGSQNGDYKTNFNAVRAVRTF